jgi:hypothetical protein
MTNLSNFRFSFRRILASFHFGSKLLIFLKRKDEKYLRLLSNKETQICIEGFPRCANSFAFNKFIEWNPGLLVSRHLHIAENVARAINQNVPTLILFRDPISAIASLSIGLPKVTIDNLCLMYIQFYKGVEQYSTKAVFAEFNEVISSFESVLEKVNMKFGTHFISMPSTNKGDLEILDRLRTHSKEMGWVSMASAPNEERNRDKEKIYESIKLNKNYSECERIYLRMHNLNLVLK